jgi:hypothetical protein
LTAFRIIRLGIEVDIRENSAELMFFRFKPYEILFQVPSGDILNLLPNGLTLLSKNEKKR